MAIVIRRLEEYDEVENFDCGDDALNNYLKRHAWTNQQKSSIGVSYVALDEDASRTVLGYFTLAMASVPRDTFPKKYVRELLLEAAFLKTSFSQVNLLLYRSQWQVGK
jgi:hypothetical protein